MKLFATLGSAFLLASIIGASSIGASAATVTTIFDDDFTEASFNDWGMTNWNTYGQSDTCGTASITCLKTTSLSMSSILVFTLEAGATYNLTAFFAQGLSESSVWVTIGNHVELGTSSMLSAVTVTTGDFVVGAEEPDVNINVNVDDYGVIGTDGNGDPIYGLMGNLSFLDRVVLKKITPDAAVPLPASAPLLLVGLASLAALRRRKAR